MSPKRALIPLDGKVQAKITLEVERRLRQLHAQECSRAVLMADEHVPTFGEFVDKILRKGLDFKE